MKIRKKTNVVQYAELTPRDVQEAIMRWLEQEGWACTIDSVDLCQFAVDDDCEYDNAIVATVEVMQDEDEEDEQYEEEHGRRRLQADEIKARMACYSPNHGTCIIHSVDRKKRTVTLQDEESADKWKGVPFSDLYAI